MGNSFVVKDENDQDQKLLQRLMCSTDTEDIWAHTGAAGSVCKTHTLTSLTANVLWVAFPARTNSLSDGSQENNTFNHTSGLYYNTWILQWWEDARTKGLASLKSLSSITAFLPLMFIFPLHQVLHILCKQCQNCTMSLTLETWQQLEVNVSGVTEEEL